MRPKAVIPTVSLAFVLALSLLLIPQESSASSPDLVPGATPNIAGSEQDFYNVSFLSNGDTYQAGSVFYLEGEVNGNSVDGLHITVLMEDPQGTEYRNLTKAESNGVWTAMFQPDDDVGGTFIVTASADAIDDYKVDDTIRILVVVPPEEEEEGIPYVYFQLGALLAAFASMAIASTESAGFSLFNIFAFPLYSRLKKDEVLDHFVRGQIYGFIVSNPGEHYNSIRENLKVTNGTLSYHLRTLEVQGFIKSRKESVYRRFYPIEMKFPRDKGVKLSDLQIAMLESMRRRRAPTQKDIASDLGISQQVASYNLRILTQKGFALVRKEGRKKMYYQDDSGSPTGL